MKLFKTSKGFLVEDNGILLDPSFDISWDELINRDNLHSFLKDSLSDLKDREVRISDFDILKPIGTQEVWAAGVTYYSSRLARMEESKDSGGGDFYSRVYVADRPEIFFKATSSRTVGPGERFRIRNDSTWDVPEPELTLAINRSGRVFGATIGNDMSSRSIEGENPLYLPQAKVYTGSASLGPCLLVGSLPGPEDEITLRISRSGEEAFRGTTALSQLKRTYDELAGFLFRENDFPDGALLMTGTGIVPDHPFTLQEGDVVSITIDGIGTLENTVAPASSIT